MAEGGGLPRYRRPQRARVADQIIDDLRDQIARGILARGAPLPREWQLAERYGVSSATVREAVRALTALGLVEVRHGSGGIVTASNDGLVATSLGTLIRLEGVSIADILGILGALNLHAAALAVDHATADDFAALDGAIAALAAAADVDAIVAALSRFLHALAAASHNPLLAALCRFLSDLQLRLALDLSKRSYARWSAMTRGLDAERASIVAALRARERSAAVAHVRTYQDRALALIEALPYGREKRAAGPALAQALAAMMRPPTEQP